MSSKYDSKKNSSKKTKYKIQVMDIITLAFTAVIVGIMVYAICSRLIGNNGSGNNTNQAGSATATPSATAVPTLTGAGNTTGNILNCAVVAQINDRTYYSKVTEDNLVSICVSVDGEEKVLFTDSASWINVIEDTVTYTNNKYITGYTIAYIDGDNQICIITDGPVYADGYAPDSLEDSAGNTGKIVHKTGSAYSNLYLDGAWAYYLDGEGNICKSNILSGDSYVLSHRKYKAFAYSSSKIYGWCADDGKVYELYTTSHTHETELTDLNTCEYEVLKIDVEFETFLFDNGWVYTWDDNSLTRYLCSTGGSDTLATDITIDALNVSGTKIVYASDGVVYETTPEGFMMDDIKTVGTGDVRFINLAGDKIYAVLNNGGELVIFS